MLIAKADLKNASEIFRRASRESEPVIFSTDTIYGIGAPVSDIKANEKIFDIKGRDRSKPFPILIASYEQLTQIAEPLTDAQKKITQKAWPGPVTFIVKAKAELNSLFTINGTVAVRMPDKEWLRSLIESTGPLSATSANPAGHEYINSEIHIVSLFDDNMKYYLFDRNLKTVSSDIIDISSASPKIIRGGKNARNLL